MRNNSIISEENFKAFAAIYRSAGKIISHRIWITFIRLHSLFGFDRYDFFTFNERLHQFIAHNEPSLQLYKYCIWYATVFHTLYIGALPLAASAVGGIFLFIQSA